MAKDTASTITTIPKGRDIISSPKPGITLHSLKIHALTKAWLAVSWAAFWVTKSAKVTP
jgi:hypothetical protein